MKKMSQKTFTEKEVKNLSKNPYVKKVSEKAITYQEEFKNLFILQIEEGKTPRMIFEQAGFERSDPAGNLGCTDKCGWKTGGAGRVGGAG